MKPGEIYMADYPPGQRHPLVVISREQLNRGAYVVAAMITSSQFSLRAKLPNCIPLRAGRFGLTKDCAVQAETAGPIRKARIDPSPIGKLDDATMRDLIRAVGYVMDADCEPI